MIQGLKSKSASSKKKKTTFLSFFLQQNYLNQTVYIARVPTSAEICTHKIWRPWCERFPAKKNIYNFLRIHGGWVRRKGNFFRLTVFQIIRGFMGLGQERQIFPLDKEFQINRGNYPQILESCSVTCKFLPSDRHLKLVPYNLWAPISRFLGRYHFQILGFSQYTIKKIS